MLAAMHAAGVTLMRGDPALVAYAFDISRRTYAIRQNLFWAFIYNVVGILLAALGLLSPVIAGAAVANHTGYDAWKGRVFDGPAIEELVEDIAERGVLPFCDGVVSGYMGSADIGTAILSALASMGERQLSTITPSKAAIPLSAKYGR